MAIIYTSILSLIELKQDHFLTLIHFVGNDRYLEIETIYINSNENTGL